MVTGGVNIFTCPLGIILHPEQLEFTTEHVLKSGNYLRVYLRNHSDVTSWDEVSRHAILPDARKMMD
ncbi:hypothetical protein EBAG_04524 [Escherichia coli T426]|nr:hypothetical protein EBAG_04524 [Escherichia coli T426]